MTRVFFLLGIAVIAALVTLRVADPFPVQSLRNAYFDLLQRVSPREYRPLPVRVVDINDEALAAVGQWPWPRDRMAELTDRIAGYGAAVIAYDVLFSEPDRLSPARILDSPAMRTLLPSGISSSDRARLDNDARFARSMEGRTVVLGTALARSGERGVVRPQVGFVEIGASPGRGLLSIEATTPVVPQLAQAATGFGSINVSPGGVAGLVRQVPMIWNTPDGPLPSLAIEVLRHALGVDTLLLSGSPDIDGFVASVRVGQFEVLTQDDGQLWVRYRRDHPDLYVGAAAVLAEGEDPQVRAALEGNLVLVGTSAAGLLDIRTTALGENVPGVSIHAQILEQILLGEYLLRNDAVEGMEVIALAVLGLAVLALMPWLGPVLSFLAGAAGAAVALGASWYAFVAHGVLVDATYPLVGGFVAFAIMAGFQYVVADREKRLIRRSFSHYVAPDILHEIESRGHDLKLGGEMREVTIMFLDIRNFTNLAEGLEASDLVSVLNDLFTDLGAEILEQSGTIDKFIGDAIMAFWNAPLPAEDHARRAGLAALGLRGALERFNARSGRAPIAAAIGLSTGPACVGNIGSRVRFNYSAIGDTVNVAARVEAACRKVGHDITVTAETAAQMPGFALLPAGALDLKGKSSRTEVFALVGDESCAASEGFRRLAEAHAKAVESLVALGPDGAEDAISACERIATEAGLDLAWFYGNLRGRAADFRAEPAVSTAGEQERAGVIPAS